MTWKRQDERNLVLLRKKKLAIEVKRMLEIFQFMVDTLKNNVTLLQVTPPSKIQDTTYEHNIM